MDKEAEKVLHQILDMLEKIQVFMSATNRRLTALEEGQIKCPKIAHTE